MEKNNSEKYFLLLGMLGGCILASYLVFVLVKNGTNDTTFATLCFVIIAAVSCCGTYLIFNKLYNLVPKSERERRKKEAQEEPNEGKIHIDEMEKNSKTNTYNIAFHYSTE